MSQETPRICQEIREIYLAGRSLSPDYVHQGWTHCEPVGTMPENRVAGGLLSPGSHSTARAGPHGAFPPKRKGSLNNGDFQRWRRREPPRPFHTGGCTTTSETRSSHPLPMVQAFTLSHPLRWAFGYYAVC